MADTDALFAHFNAPESKPAGVIFSGLVLNEKGLERGLACGVEMFCMGVSASETHSQKNTGMRTGEALSRILPMAETAMRAGKRVQASVHPLGCGYEGPSCGESIRIVKAYLGPIRSQPGGYGWPRPAHAGEALYAAIHQLDPAVELACHFHNTYGLGLANCYAALKSGVTSFETAFGGMGGCPFTRLPAGNVSTEDWVHSLQRMGFRLDIHLDQLLAVARQVGDYFNRDLPGFILKSGSIVQSDNPAFEEAG
jgi:hydroxymethylglutaryl-CoA lyase